MTLLISLFAAMTSTLLWYFSNKEELRFSILCYLFWGASLMWMVDAFFEYKEMGVEFFNKPLAEITNDAFLGLSVVAFGIFVWLVALLLKDPRKKIFKRN